MSWGTRLVIGLPGLPPRFVFALRILQRQESCNSWLVGHALRCARLQDRRYKARHLAPRRVVDEPRESRHAKCKQMISKRSASAHFGCQREQHGWPVDAHALVRKKHPM